MRFDVLTLFPEMFPGYLGQSLLRRAIDAGLVQVQLHNLRGWATGPHAAVDDRPFGGGPGMVLKAEPVVEAVEAVQAEQQNPGHLVMALLAEVADFFQTSNLMASGSAAF